jgi:AraC-like DNA-binding protein
MLPYNSLMQNPSTPLAETNLVLADGVRIEVSNPNPTGGGAHDPVILFNERIHSFDIYSLAAFGQQHTFDTFRGRGRTNELDWYAITFPKAVRFNCIEMTMGLPFRDGGWWTSLNVETQAEAGQPWQPVRDLSLLPDYPFRDLRANRRPYETYLLRFEETKAAAVRIIGTPGGLEKFTSLARLAVYQRDFSRWSPLDLPPPPVPHVFRLISPGEIFDISESLAKVTGLDISFSMMEYFLDDERFQRYWQRVQANYTGEPQLWILVGDTVGWNYYQQEFPRQVRLVHTRLKPEPSIEITFHGVQAAAVAPLVVEDQQLGSFMAGSAVINRDLDLHAQLAAQYNIPWDAYRAALDRSVFMTIEQMEGMAELIGLIANSIARLAHRASLLEIELDIARSTAASGQQAARKMIEDAIHFMQENLEEEIGIGDVARHVCLNPSYFSTQFSKMVGQSPAEFLTHLRLERAKEYLRDSSMSVMDICVALGYTPSYFNRLFKRHTQTTPGQYARKMRGNASNSDEKVT